MLRTRTICVGPEGKLIELINEWEGVGWAVRQIVPSTNIGHAYVIFEGFEGQSEPVIRYERPFPVNTAATSIAAQDSKLVARVA